LKKADILYSGFEPPAIGTLALLEAKKYGVIENFIPMPQNPDSIIKCLRESKSDAIILMSPVFYADFFISKSRELLSIGKPIIELVYEWTWGSHLGFHRNWQENRIFNADFYFCQLDTDRKKMLEIGRRAYPLKAFVSKDAYQRGYPLSQRVQKFCFIGSFSEEAPKAYLERRRLLNALLKNNLIDLIQVPKGISSNHIVSYAYATYAGVFCPPCNNLCHSIRPYEAALAGAFIFEVQNICEENRVFFNNQHAISIQEGIDENELCQKIASVKFTEFSKITDNAREMVLKNHLPQGVISEILETALGEANGLT
jgi:hypothetical protein